MNDLLNGLFEFVGAILLLMHIRRILTDRCVKGVAAIPFVFYMLWGFWNLWFYPSVDCWWSFHRGRGSSGYQHNLLHPPVALSGPQASRMTHATGLAGTRCPGGSVGGIPIRRSCHASV